MEIRAIKTSIFRENQDLLSFILKYAKKIKENSVLVISSKIVSLSEGRTAPFSQKEKLIKKESKLALKTGDTWFTVKDGLVMAASGIDESNADGKITLLPKDSFRSAKKIRQAIQKELKLKNLGVIIADSNFLPLRSGAVGIALGYAGFRGVKSYIDKKDIFGRVLKFSRTNVADSLATTAVLLLGEGNEQTPMTLITGAPVSFSKKINKREMKINPKKDLYAPLFNKIN